MAATDRSRRTNLEEHRRRQIEETEQRLAQTYDEDPLDEDARIESQDAADEARGRLEEARYDGRMNRRTIKP
jgi:hypothetical protein